MPTCSVIVVTHDSEAVLPKALDCLFRQSRPADQVLLVDTGSKDFSFVRQFASDVVEVYHAGDEAGFCAGNNAGYKKLKENTDYILLLNPDAFLTENFIADAIAYMEANRQVAVVTGTLLGYAIEKDQPTGCYDSTGIFHSWYGKWYDRGQGDRVEEGHYTDIEKLPAACGALMFCRKSALDTVSKCGKEIFDQALYMYKEDIELSLRLRQKGWQLHYYPKLLAYHCRGWSRSRRRVPRRFRLLSARNELKIHLSTNNPIWIIYSLLKYLSVYLFNV